MRFVAWRRALAQWGWRFACAALVMTVHDLARSQGTDLGCEYELGDYEYGWAADVAPEPVDVAYARAAAHAFDILRRQRNWETFHKRGLDVLRRSGVSTKALSNGGSRTIEVEIQPRPRGYWSLQHSRTDRWLYDIHMYVEVITVTECPASGHCTSHTGEYDWALCGTGGDVPYRIELQAPPTTRITPSLQPVRLKMRLMHGELPVRQSVHIQETLGRHKAFGHLACAPMECPLYLYVDPDDQGYFELEFRPGAFKPATIPLSFTCTDCDNTVQTTLVMQPEVVVGFFNGVANTREDAQKSMYRLAVELGSYYKETPFSTTGSTTRPPVGRA